jgi:integrase
MPYKEEMNWDQSKKRWHRFHKGVMYRVVASHLHYDPMQKTVRDATRQAANDWWLKKFLEIEGPPQRDEYTQFFEEIKDGPRSEGQALVDEIAADIVPLSTYKRVTEALEAGLTKSAKITERSIKACGESFLAVKRGGMKPRTYEEIAVYIQSLSKHPEFLEGQADVAIIDEALVEKMYLQLREAKSSKGEKLSDGRKKKHWGFFQRFAKYLWERRLIEMPRNLNAYKFQVSPKKVKEYPIEKVREVLGSLKPRLKLYALLGLNIGATNVDIANLNKVEVDLKNGRITRRRTKTKDKDNVPDVCYKLWPETLKLLKKHESTHETLFLTNMKNRPLLETRIEDGKARRYDMIVQQWKRAKPDIALKAFRSISATLLESHEIYGRVTSLFLGHSPRSISDRHYAAAPEALLHEGLAWLRTQLFPIIPHQVLDKPEEVL